MSACLTFICDGEFAEGLCTQRLTLRTTDLAAAESLAKLAGWSIKARHTCPACARAGR